MLLHEISSRFFLSLNTVGLKTSIINAINVPIIEAQIRPPPYAPINKPINILNRVEHDALHILENATDLNCLFRNRQDLNILTKPANKKLIGMNFAQNEK